MSNSRGPRQPADGQGAAGSRLLDQQGAGRAADARERHPRPAQAALPGDDGLDASPAGSENLLDRNFTPTAPNQIWTADITCLWSDEGWLYLAIVLDLFNREVVGWSLKPRMAAEIVTDALTMAWFRRKPGPGLIHHSDRGSQYASRAFQERFAEHDMTCSMSRKGNCWENKRSADSRADRREGKAWHNAPTESFFNSYKNERVHGTRYVTRNEAIADAVDYIEPFYNRRRRHSTLGYGLASAVLERLDQASA